MNIVLLQRFILPDGIRIITEYFSQIKSKDSKVREYIDNFLSRLKDVQDTYYSNEYDILMPSSISRSKGICKTRERKIEQSYI